MKSITVRVGLAEFEVRNEFGVYRLYASGYGRPEREVGTLVGDIEASVFLDLLRRGGEDARSIPVLPADATAATIIGPVDARRWAGNGAPMPTLAT